ncbi:hypothetical protein [Methylocucumis oryzae]|uniref:Uncharacterized protein n=1 Tax=Methylocucumis oryzae TaxID=1632867 RepID=A0A0F3IMV4_9GAMM|nr:hypothetical protein [Methylocucumis oryzae]KJV08027.1 hypothetical protein VZ94_01050 [Methylocucumis oryzae]
MLDPIKVAVGEYMGRFYAEITPNTKVLIEYVGRGLPKSIQWCPSRMIDSTEEMIEAWQRNDTDSAPTQPYKSPVILVAMARDYTPTGRDFTRQVANAEDFIYPDDEKERIFKVKTVSGDVRVQVVILSQEEPSAKSLAAQFTLFVDGVNNRRMPARFKNLLGNDENWPVVLSTPEVSFFAARGQSKNNCVLLSDLTFKFTAPLYFAPKVEDENNDNQGVPGTTDPSGYLAVDYSVEHPGEAKP